TVSHDLRAPLRQVAGFVRLLAEGVSGRLDPSSAEYLSLIEEGAVRVGQLIDDLFAFSRLGRAAPAESQVPRRPLPDEVRELLQPSAAGRAVEWKIGSLPVVRADAALMRLVLTNLLDNAIKFTRGRAPAVIEVGCTSNPTEHVFVVRDNGVGFDK